MAFELLFKNTRVPITYVVKTQILYVDLFGIEDDEDGDKRGLAQKRKSYQMWLDKMFLDDSNTRWDYDLFLNRLVYQTGTYKEICDFLRAKGYEVLSLSNATKEEIVACEKECLANWKKWKEYKR